MPESNQEDGVVYLHMFARSICRQAPNISPFAIKAETWLRMHDINFKVIETMDIQSSPTGQIPYVKFNGKVLADSGFIIDFLTKEFDMDATEGLSPEQRGIARALTKMVEENMSFTIFHHRYVLHPEQYQKVFKMGETKEQIKQVQNMMVASVGNRTRLQGIGRKTEEEVGEIGKGDMLALSQCLGDKPFFMGDKPTKVDCSIFGMLTQLDVDVAFAHKEVLNGEGKNLMQFLQRMKERFWPDWDDLVNSSAFE